MGKSKEIKSKKLGSATCTDGENCVCPNCEEDAKKAEAIEANASEDPMTLYKQMQEDDAEQTAPSETSLNNSHKEDLKNSEEYKPTNEDYDKLETKYKTEMVGIQNVNEDLLKSNSNLEEELRVKSEDYKQIQEDKSKLEKELEQAQKTIEESQKTIDQATEMFGAAETEKSKLEKELESYRKSKTEESKDYTKELNDAKEALKLRSEDLIAIETEKSELVKKVEGYEKTISKDEQEKAELKSYIQELEQEKSEYLKQETKEQPKAEATEELDEEIEWSSSIPEELKQAYGVTDCGHMEIIVDRIWVSDSAGKLISDTDSDTVPEYKPGVPYDLTLFTQTNVKQFKKSNSFLELEIENVNGKTRKERLSVSPAEKSGKSKKFNAYVIRTKKEEPLYFKQGEGNMDVSLWSIVE